ncbi:MAG: tetratricopeptide repeat protein [Prolixibacteraceae bacterium]|nr:tetratricopeptide repeat protein [Prolixibacteraceae bacterium]
MRYFVTYLLFFLMAFTGMGQQLNMAQSEAQLAASFYQNKEYEKAAKLYQELFQKTSMAHYFDYYINSLVYLKEYDTAVKELRKEIRKTNNTNLEIILGYVYKEMGDLDKSRETYDNIIKNLPRSNGVIINIGNTFFNRLEFEYAEKTYLRGREILQGEMFYSNLANVYAYQRDYPRMMQQYMAWVREDEKNVAMVQSRLNSLLRNDFDGSLMATIKKEVIKSTQTEPEVIAYNRLLIWLFVIQKDYAQALNNTLALDRRTHTEEANILSFTRGAAQAGLYDVALSGLNHLLIRKPAIPNLSEVKQEIVAVQYQQHIHTPPKQRGNGQALANAFKELLDELGYTAETTNLIRTYAHYLAFYLGRTNESFEVLQKGLNVRNLNNLQRSLLRIEQADINVYNNNLWEATLQYAQIIELNRENSIGDEVKLKRAKVSFYLGDVEWARGQLDVLKASTSKLIANDAMELSLLITANYDLDSIDDPIQRFARGDLFLFQNNDSMAFVTYDSILSEYPNHSLSDKILLRKATISELRFEFELAAALYQRILDQFTFSSSADDAMYHLAILYEEKLNKTDQASELYKKLLIDYPGSIFVDDARQRYRTLRGDFKVDQEITPYESTDFIIR